VRHWMIPLFSPLYRSYREHILRICSVPLCQCIDNQHHNNAQIHTHTHTQTHTQTQTQTHIHTHKEEEVKDKENHHTLTRKRVWFREAIPVLYGLSPSVVARPGYWPDSVRLTGE